MVRFIIISLFAMLVIFYAGISYYFYEQERWATMMDELDSDPPEVLRHPEAALGVIRSAFDSNDYSDTILVHLRRALREAPSSYLSVLYLAAFRANRLENPAEVRKSFEAALRLFPANGRLHLTYAQWLLSPRPRVLRLYSAYPSSNEATDYQQAAENHLRSAFLLEPDLIGDGLKLLSWRNVPAERWIELIPDTWPARRRLLSALAGSGRRTEALELLKEMMQLPQEKEFLSQAASWAFQWGDPRLALEAGERWQAEELAGRSGGSSLARATMAVARIHMTLGDPAAAYQVFRGALDELISRSGPSSGASLELLTGMATVYLQAGQIVMAQSLFQKAIDLAPHHAPAFLGLARTERRAGNLEAAVDQYREALRLEPEDENVKTELDGLLMEIALTSNRR